MTARVLQRLVIRMLYDPQWVDEVYENPEAALSPFDLTSAERGWLHAPDKRRWSADPARAQRTLETMLEEYPVAFAQAVALKGFGAVGAFFTSPYFHRSLEPNGSLALNFGDFLKTWPSAVSVPATLECAMAMVRRTAPLSPLEGGGPPKCWQTNPTVVPLILPRPSLSLWLNQSKSLKSHPSSLVEAVLSPHYRPIDFDVNEPVSGTLITGENGISAGDCPVELAQFLISLQTPRERSDLNEQLYALGAEQGEEDEILTALCDDGLLMPLRITAPVRKT